jgi:hypothetical protein
MSAEIGVPGGGGTGGGGGGTEQSGRRPRIEIGGLLLAYRYPQLSKDTGTKTKKHEIIGRPDVVQNMGPKAIRVSLRGHCYRDEAFELLDMRFEDYVSLRHPDFNGDVVVEEVSIEPEGARGGRRRSMWRYIYRIEAVEISPPA